MVVRLRNELHGHFTKTAASPEWQKTLKDINTWQNRLKGVRSNCTLHFEANQLELLYKLVKKRERAESGTFGSRLKELAKIVDPKDFFKKQDSPAEGLIENADWIVRWRKFWSPGSFLVEVKGVNHDRHAGAVWIGTSIGQNGRRRKMRIPKCVAREPTPLKALAEMAK